ncbi:MAG: carboxypeptidase regulatory-like domain-containing protein, partial [Armatimonadetes bacterium]|nr:carboxypeptidase regulatory-like domain-containing protein [Armatimonadota bacterium]
SGTVRGALGTAGAGATVRLEGTTQTTVADGNGEFAFNAAPVGRYTLSVATGAGLGAATVVIVEEGGVTFIPPLPLDLGGQIVGLITSFDSNGNTAPVAGARVTARPQPMLWDYPNQVEPGVLEGVEAAGGAAGRQAGDAPLPVRVAITDSEGSFRFSAVAPGPYSIEVSAAGCEAGETGTWVEPGRTGTADLALERIDPDNATVSGLVASTSGEPLPWARVMLWPAGLDQPVYAMQEGAPVDPLYLPPFRMGKEIYTDEQGRYSLRNIAPGQYTLSFWVYGYDAVERQVTLAARETRTENATLSSNLTTVSGTVYRRDGGALVPVAGAFVSAFTPWIPMAVAGADGNLGCIPPYIDQVTDAQGRFSREVIRGTVELYAWEASYGSAWQQVEVGAGGLTGVELVLEPDPLPRPEPGPEPGGANGGRAR